MTRKHGHVNKVPLTLWIEPAALTQIEDIAERDGLLRAHAARRLLDYAILRMPAGWHIGIEPYPEPILFQSERPPQ